MQLKRKIQLKKKSPPDFSKSINWVFFFVSKISFLSDQLVQRNGHVRVVALHPQLKVSLKYVQFVSQLKLNKQIYFCSFKLFFYLILLRFSFFQIKVRRFTKVKIACRKSAIIATTETLHVAKHRIELETDQIDRITGDQRQDIGVTQGTAHPEIDQDPHVAIIVIIVIGINH